MEKQGKTVMIVEDDQFIADIYEKKLAKEGYNVVALHDGQAALDWVAAATPEQIPDIMLLDIVMPRMDGFRFLENVRKSHPKMNNVPIIMLTNLSQKHDVERGRSLGVRGYIIKSHFTPTEVLEKVQAFLERQQ